jgi:hypothetical protein
MENRIDGYCSCYCRDIHELEVENNKLLRQRNLLLDTLRKAIPWWSLDATHHPGNRMQTTEYVESINRIIAECEKGE